MTTILIKLDLLKTASTFASKDERYYLKGVLVTSRDNRLILVATDGQILTVIRPTENSALVQGEFAEFIFPAETISAISIKCKSKETAWCVIDTANNRISACALNFDKAESGLIPVIQRDGIPQNYTPIDGTFPDWTRVIPKLETYTAPLTAPVRFDPHLLKRLAVLGHGLDFFFNSNSTSSAIFQREDEDSQIFGLILPLRCSAESITAIPAWLSFVPAMPQWEDQAAPAA